MHLQSRSQKASFNIISMAISESAAMLSSLILPRLILTHYGSAYNGIASSAAQFLSLISVLTLGVTASTRVALYKTLAANDCNGTSSIVRATEKYMRKIAAILMIYILGLAALYPIIVKTGFSYYDVALIILITGLSSFAEYFFGITYRTLLLADQSVYISNIFNTISTILSLVVAVLLINVGCSFQIVKLGAALVHIVKLILQNQYVTRHYKLDKKCKPDLSAIEGRKDAMTHALANIVHDNTDIVVLTLFADVKTVSVYTIYNLVMSALKKIQLVFNTGTEPIFGNMWAKGEAKKLKSTLEFYEFTSAMFCSIFFSTTLITILSFVKIYTHGVTDIEYIRPVYALVISIATAVQIIRTPYVSFIGGIGHYKQTKNAAIFEAVTNLSLSIILINIIGIGGVAIGTFAANLIRTLHYGFYIDNHVIKRGKWKFLGKIIWAFGNIFVLYIVYYLLFKNVIINGWVNWIVFAAIVFLISILFTVLSSLIFYRNDLIETIKRLLNIVKRSFNVNTIKK